MDRAEFPRVEGNVPLLESRKEMHYSKSSSVGKDALKPAVVDTQSAGEGVASVLTGESMEHGTTR